MKTFAAVLVLMTLALLGMAIGVMLSGRRLRGSCGGVGVGTNENGEKVCGICGQGGGSCKESDLSVGASP